MKDKVVDILNTEYGWVASAAPFACVGFDHERTATLSHLRSPAVKIGTGDGSRTADDDFVVALSSAAAVIPRRE